MIFHVITKLTKLEISFVTRRFCGNSKPPVLYSSGNKLQVVFKTDESVTFRGFLAIYKALNDTDLPPTTTGRKKNASYTA